MEEKTLMMSIAATMAAMFNSSQQIHSLKIPVQQNPVRSKATAFTKGKRHKSQRIRSNRRK